VVPGNYFKP